MSDDQIADQEMRVLDELRRNFAFGRSRNDALEGRSVLLVSSSSLVSGLLGAAQTATIASPTDTQERLLFAILLLFLATLGSGIYIWLPIHPRHRPMTVDWDSIKVKYLESTNRESYFQTLSNYIFAIEEEGKRNTRFANALVAGGIGFALQIVLWAVLLVA